MDNLVPIAFFFAVYKIFELFVRRNERQRLIDMLPNLVDKTNLETLNLEGILGTAKGSKDTNKSLKVAATLLGAGIGAAIAFCVMLLFSDELKTGMFADFTSYVVMSNLLWIFSLLGAGAGLLWASISIRNKEK